MGKGIMMNKERGQTLVILAFALIALAAFAGLAIDGGRLYAARRQAQNTADASAMAGARLLASYVANCTGIDRVVADNNIAAEMVKLARDNGIDPLLENASLEGWYVDAAEARLGRVGWGAGVPDNATGIYATLTTTDTTTFLKIVGRQHIVAPGEATAMAGRVMQMGGGIIPIGVPLEVVRTLNPGETFYMMENAPHNGGAFCRDPNGTMCIGDVTAANAHRGWLNLNYIYNTEHRTANDSLNRSFEQNVPNRGCGNIATKSIDDGLQGWAGDDCPYPFPIIAGTPGFIDGDFIHGDPGARQSSLMDVINTYNYQVVYVPIFDNIYMSDYMKANFTAPANPVPDGSLNGDNWPRAGGGGHAFLYHIVGFAAVQITDNKINDHYLVGNFQSAVVGSSQIQPGAGFSGSGSACNSTGVMGVQLWR